MKDYYTVGEIAKIFNMNVQTLHYYESIGLFSPFSRNNKNGYRIYEFDQVYKLATIRYLKKLGYSLKQVQEYMDTRNVHLSLDQLKIQSAQIMKKWEELKRVNDVIQRKIQFIEEKTRSIDISSIEISSFPIRHYIPIGREDVLYRSDDFYFYPTVVFYKGSEKKFGALITHEGFTDNSKYSPKEIPAGEFLCGYNKGPYDTIEQTFARIYEFAMERKISLASEIVNLNIIDQFVENDKEKYITEIQMRKI